MADPDFRAMTDAVVLHNPDARHARADITAALREAYALGLERAVERCVKAAAAYGPAWGEALAATYCQEEIGRLAAEARKGKP